MRSEEQSCRLIERYHETLRERPNATAFIWVDKNANQTLSYTYQELDHAARGLAQKLSSEGIRKGDTVLLAYGPGFDFFIAFWGCLISGIVAAPVTPPISSKDVEKFIKLYRHCDGRMILTDKRFARLLKAKAYKEKLSDVGRGVRSLLSGSKRNERASAYSALIEERWLTTSGLPVPAEPHVFSPQPPDATAFIMYSSGSTSAPKGALTTFGNLSHQLEMNGQALDCSPDHVSCWWAPHYHDYGLISGFLNVIYQGCKGVLASPFDFIQHPPLWLDMLHKYGGTHTFGPDFGYDLLIRKTRQSDREASKWNLRPLKVAMSAAEKVRAATIDAFSTAFAPCGFRREVFCPAYGLAEHTVGVTINGVRAQPVVQCFLRKPLEEDGVALNADAEDDYEANDERLIELVGNGITRFETDLQIVKLDRDGDPLDVMPPGCVGEVWVSSESKTIGYFKEEALTKTAFRAQLPDGTKPEAYYLRTGDLGFISKENGELFICGRQKDMIILAGKNHYSEDLEVTLSNHTREFLRPGRIAAFSFEEKGSATERLGIAAEVRSDDIDRAQAFHVIKTCLASEHKINVSTIALIKSGSIPKTSSGKLRRFEARERLLDNTLDIINHGIWTAPVKDLDAAPSYEETLAMLINTIERLQTSDAHVDALTQIPSLKLSPLALAQLEEAIREDHPHAEFHIETLSHYPTPKDLAAFLIQEDDTSKSKAIEPIPELTTHPSTASDRISTLLHPLLYAQERALNEVRGPLDEPRVMRIAGWLQGSISIAALRRSLDWLTQRHAVLRTTFERGKDGSYGQFVQTEWPEDFLQTRDARDDASAIEQAQQLANEPLNPAETCFKVNLFTLRSDRHLLLMTFHPAIYDHWSAELLLNELATLYAAAAKNEEPTGLPSQPFQLVDLAHWQQGLLQTHAFDRRIAFWKSYLRTPLHPLKIPADRYPGRSTAGIAVSLNVSKQALQGIRSAASRWKTSPQVIYMTAYAAVLSRRYRQHEVIVKVPTPARTEETLNTAGAITEATWIRVSVPRKTAFETLVVQNTQSYDKAMQHELPLGLLFEALEHDASELERLSWAALSIGDGPLPGGIAPRPFGQASFEPLALGKPGRITMPVDSHSILSLWVDEAGILQGSWACKQSMMSQSDLQAMATSLERILIAISKSLNEGPSLEDTVELRAAAGTHGVRSSHVFSRGKTHPPERRDLSRPALEGDGSRAEDRVQRPAVPALGSRDLFTAGGNEE